MPFLLPVVFTALCSQPVPPPAQAAPAPRTASPAGEPAVPKALAIGRDTLRAILSAQQGPGSPALRKAWAFHAAFRGSWQPGAPRPKAEDLAAFDAFKAELEKAPTPGWCTRMLQEAAEGRLVAPEPVLDPASPAFAASKQTEETERLKALALIYLTEHELDRPGAAQKGGVLLNVLLIRTWFDHEVHELAARLLTDAKRHPEAADEARLALQFDPAPDANALRFALFILLMDGGPARWEAIQATLRASAAQAGDIHSVIAEWDAKIRDGKINSFNTLDPGAPDLMKKAQPAAPTKKD